MQDKIILSIFFLIFVLWGVLGVLFPEFMYKTTATNTLKKTPNKETVKRYKTSGYIILIIGLLLIITTWLGGFKGV